MEVVISYGTNLMEMNSFLIVFPSVGCHSRSSFAMTYVVLLKTSRVSDGE